MLFHAVKQATQQSLLEQLKPLGRRSRLTKALPQQTGRRSPKCFQIDVSVGEIACRESEKRKSAARFEVNPDDKGFFRGREAAPMRTRNDRTGKAGAVFKTVGVVKPQLVLPEIDYEFERAGRKNAFGPVLRLVAFV